MDTVFVYNQYKELWPAAQVLTDQRIIFAVQTTKMMQENVRRGCALRNM